jgi:hypothetical protein
MRRAKLSEKRRWERARKRFDKFLPIEGPTPIPLVRGPSAGRSDIAIIEEDDPTLTDPMPLIVDVHHSDRKTKVLYELDEILHSEFNFRDTILDQLDRYYFYLGRMRRYDPCSFGFYKQLGAWLVPYIRTGDLIRSREQIKEVLPEFQKMSPWFMQTKPAFGCVAFGTSPEIERVERDMCDTIQSDGRKHNYFIPRFVYFIRYTMPPPEVQLMHGGDIYKLTIWFDKDNKHYRYGRPYEVPIFVTPDGTVKVLKILDTKWIGSQGSEYPQRAWRKHVDWKRYAKDHHMTDDQFFGGILYDVADAIEQCAHSVIRVSVTNDDGEFASFQVDAERLPYFFKDRKIELTVNGRRKPIFHMVRAHVKRDGTSYPMRFQGQREFDWGPYHVLITVPGLDHGRVEEFNAGCYDSYWTKRSGKKFTNQPEVGRALRRLIHPWGQ